MAEVAPQGLDEVLQEELVPDSPGPDVGAGDLQAALDQMDDPAEVTQENLQAGVSHMSLPAADVTQDNLPAMDEPVELAAEAVAAEALPALPGSAKGSRPTSGQNGLPGLPSKVSDHAACSRNAGCRTHAAHAITHAHGAGCEPLFAWCAPCLTSTCALVGASSWHGRKLGSVLLANAARLRLGACHAPA